MQYLKTFALGALIVMAFAILPGGVSASSSSYSYSSSYSSPTSVDAIHAQLQSLIAQLKELQSQLAKLQNAQHNNNTCYQGVYGTQFCYTGAFSLPTGNNKLRDIQVEMEQDFARVHVEYTNGRDEDFLFSADSHEEVIEFLMDETDATRNQILAVIDFDGTIDNDDSNDEDIESIDVVIEDGDADVRVEYEDGDTDRFTLRNEDDEDTIIEEIADRLNIDESDVENVIDFDVNGNNNNDDVDSIDVTVYEDDEEARARVEYDNGDVDTFNYDTDDEDDVIEELADDLDMDEDDVEDVIDFIYRD